MLAYFSLSATVVQPKPKVDEAEVKAMTEMFKQIADPDNSHFEDFQRHFGKVIDQLKPGANHDKDGSRLDKLAKDMEASIGEYSENHPNHPKNRAKQVNPDS